MVLEDYLHNDKVLIVAYNGQLTSQTLEAKIKDVCEGFA